jgi:hypothetical protein
MDTSRTYRSTFQELVWHANTADTGGRYTSNQQLYDSMYTAWRVTSIPGKHSTLYLLPTEGVAHPIDVQAKCHAHFLSRCLQQLQTEDVYTAAWLKFWNSHFYMATALHMRTIPTRLHYLRLYFH